MRRRQVLQAAAALPILPFLPAVLFAKTAPFRRVRPGDPGWPSPATWQRLDRSVGGSLQRVTPLLAPCEGNDPASCATLLEELHNPYYIGDQAGGTQTCGWLNAWERATSVYAVKARGAADVVAAVNFARTHHLRLVVKGGGHSYLGTSNAPDSLLVWTRAMNDITHHEAFVGEGCAGRVPPQPAVSLGAGAMWIDAYNAVTTERGRYVQGGGCTNVGVAGLIQSGGFGSFSKGFGTAAAGLIEAEVVTADGSVRLANACSNPELYWALKGGGGGSFGVVTRVTLRTHDLPASFGGAFGLIKARSDEAFRRLIADFIAFYATNLKNPHWGEQVAVREDNSLKFSLICQGLPSEEVKALWNPFFAKYGTAPADYEIKEPLRSGAHGARDWWKLEGNPAMFADTRPGAMNYHGWWKGDGEQVDVYLHGYESLWLPESLLEGAAQAHLSEALFAASRHKEVGLHFNKGLAGAPAPAIAATLDTATNPELTRAFALAIIADGEAGTPFEIAVKGAPGKPVRVTLPKDPRAAEQDARAVDFCAAELFKVAPGAGSYVSESNYFNARWAQAYWGVNYPRLQAVKKQYDPEGLFFVHNGVGSEEWSVDGFTRLA